MTKRIVAIEPTHSTPALLNTLLNQRLSEAVDLQMMLKQAHWNVKGSNFICLHQLFDSIYNSVVASVDQIAERIVQTGGIAEGTVRASAARSRLADYPLTLSEGPAHLEAVAKALTTFRHEVRNTVDEADEMGDAETADLFLGISRSLDKWVWFVEAHGHVPT
ncbi:MAG TPA: DNA starvation/stationary phase protection protein Dps [Planctomycetes bacterium]|nr:DNA starvation/stationary phase protection protein Dps [Planctomycetota bacterium]